jgi:hypothetical protein
MLTGAAFSALGIYVMTAGKDYSGGAAPLGGLQGIGDLFIGMDGGFAIGALLGYGLYEFIWAKEENFYAHTPKLNSDVVLSMNLYNNRF